MVKITCRPKDDVLGWYSWIAEILKAKLKIINQLRKKGVTGNLFILSHLCSWMTLHCVLLVHYTCLFQLFVSLFLSP